MRRPITAMDMGKAGAAAFANATPFTAADSNGSPIVQKLAARERPVTFFETPEFASLLDDPCPRLGFRIAVIDEQDTALVGAYAYIAKRAEVASLIATDPVFVEATKTLHILREVIRLPNGLPAFPDIDWMRENFTAYEIRLLLDRYNSVVQASQPGAGKVEPEWVADLAMRCAEFEGTNVPDVALSECSRSMLVEMFIRLSMMWRTECNENAALRAAVEAYEARAETQQDPSVQRGDPQ